MHTPKDTESDRKLDATGLICPMPVLRTRKALKELSPGKVLEVTATDPAAWADMAAFCQATGHVLKDRRRDGDRLIFRVEKTGA